MPQPELLRSQGTGISHIGLPLSVRELRERSGRPRPAWGQQEQEARRGRGASCLVGPALLWALLCCGRASRSAWQGWPGRDCALGVGRARAAV